MWQKLGNIFNVNHLTDDFVSHACVPTAYKLNKNVIRVFYAPRNLRGQSLPTFIDVDSTDPTKIIYVHTESIMSLGELGTFDDGGIMPCSIVYHEGKLYMYYVGWNPSVSVPYRNSIGLAVSTDGGYTFERMFKGPIVDRNRTEPFFTASPCVVKMDNQWFMWYASSTGFVKTENAVEPLYHIKFASSVNGIDWQRENISCIFPKHQFEANARPTVLFKNGIYKMWFTFRGSFDYRDGIDSYRIGYAESTDGIIWTRMDEKCGISLGPEIWDSKMLTYPSVIESGDDLFLFYNGNGFGKTGIGASKWVY